MTAATEAPTSRKRKATDEMDQSPPKRVTRARAAKTADAPMEPQVSKKRITTASTRQAAEAKVAVKPAKTSTRQPRATIAKTKEKEAVEQAEAPITAAPRTRGRPKKTVLDAELAKGETVVVKTRGREATAASAVKDAPAAPTRSRPTTSRSTRATSMAVEEPVVLAGKTTRKAAVPAAPAPSTVAAAKKKVTFQEPSQDKENLPVKTGKGKKAVPEPNGMGAKPIRKPRSVRASTRTTKDSTATTSKPEAKAPAPAPLSPKKNVQVAKSESAGSEDELGGQSPVRILTKSPIKLPPRAQRLATPKRQQTNPHMQDNAITSLNRTLNVSVIASPARRPPPSALKDSRKESPRRVNIFSSSMKPPGAEIAQPELRVSLLRSPARRPASPFKTCSPGKLPNDVPVMNASSLNLEANNFKLPALTPQVLFSSPLRARNTEPKLHKMTPLEQKTLAMASPADQTPCKAKEVAPHELTIEDSIDPEVNKEKLIEDTRPSTPPGVPTMPSFPLFNFTPAFRYPNDMSESEDELQSPQGRPYRSPLAKYAVGGRDFATTPTTSYNSLKTQSTKDARDFARNQIDFTPLAMQLSSWLAASPPKSSDANSSSTGSVGESPVKMESSEQFASAQKISPAKTSFFEDEMIMTDNSPEDIVVLEDQEMETAIDSMEFEACKEESFEIEQYGDENAMPVDMSTSLNKKENMLIDPILLSMPQGTVIVESTMTPVQKAKLSTRIIHTVSKVPLRAAADDPALYVTKKRSKSMFGTSTLRGAVREPLVDSKASTPAAESSHTAVFEEEHFMEEASSIHVPVTPSQVLSESSITPFKSVRKGADAQILRGAVVFVDVHTTEGADASGIFVELLTQMGARCVKQWSWNSRGSMAGPGEKTESTLNNKVGITHVVFKDGGKRTLQKVREAKGLVLAVGVAWVLE
jgi:hypothetical protein